MGQANIILFFVGILVTLIGVTSLIVPNIAKIISAPGAARLKAAVSIIVGLILIIISLLFEIPG